MRHSAFCFCLLLILLVPHSSLGGTKTVIINWTQSGTSEIVGYRMYYSYDSSMPNKMLACETSQTTITSLTCTDVNLEQSPVYFVVAAQTTTGETNSAVASGNWVTGISAVQDFRLTVDPSLPQAGWTNYQVSYEMRSTDNDDLGLMFRYKDPQNYYRFSWGAERSYRRLVKCENGTFTLLAGDTVPYNQDQAYQIVISVENNTLELAIDGTQLFSVNDSSFSAGTIAFYSWGNSSSYFSNLSIKAIPSNEILLSESFSSGELSNWMQIDEGTSNAPGSWVMISSELEQSSNIFSYPLDVENLSKQGTFLIYKQ